MKRVFAEQLAANLNTQLSQIYCLVGQDPLLLDESSALIYQCAQTQGFDERFRLQIETNTDWNDLFERAQSLGLFFSKQIIHLILPENVTATQQKNLSELIGLLCNDILLILQCAKLSKSMEQQAWFKQAVLLPSVLVNCQTPTATQLPNWVLRRAQQMELQLDNEAINLLCYSYENNLLALKQTLQLLALIYPQSKLTFPRVQEIVEQSSIFTPFQWVDALLEGKESRARRILLGLRNEDIQPVLLLRSLQRELLLLLNLSQPARRSKLTDSLPIQQIREHFDRLKVWQSRRPILLQAMQRLTYARLYFLIQQLADIERLLKQDFSADVWDKLQSLSVECCLK